MVVLRILVLLVAALALTGLVYRPDPSPLHLSRETVEVDGTRLGYHQVGNGPDVVLLHGSMGSAEDFEPVLAALARDFRVTAVDRPGFGRSLARGNDPTYPGNARLLEGLVRALGLRRPIVVGHSHGGGVALLLAAAYPDVPRGLVLLAPAAYPQDRAGALERVTGLPLFGEGVAAWIGPWLGPRTIAGLLDPMIAPDRARLPPDFVAYRQQLWTNPLSLAVHARQRTSDLAGLTEIAARIGQVTVPSVIVACAQDPTEAGVVDSRRLARELPHTELWWLEGCGHYIQYSHPEKVVEAIRTVHDRAGGA